MSKALYRRYRSKSLSEIVGQEHITDTLTNAIKQGRISHAYLFTGPRGVGKTSIARILAHEVNHLPYSDDTPHIDIIEIDAASNRRIDEIRDLRDKVHIAPTSAQYKVYIIDEVHMLTREAFNALLKTLEEPPAHAIFILATTDAHKLPDTIVSRTQRYTFKPVSKSKVTAHLADIAKQENINVNQEALELLAEHGEGSFRDSISLLDQASGHSSAIEAEAIRTLLGIPPAEAIDELYALITGHAAAAECMRSLNNLYDQGFQAASISKQLAGRLRQVLLEGTATMPASEIIKLLDELLRVSAAHEPERYLEIVLLGRASITTIAPKPVKKSVDEQPLAPQAEAPTIEEVPLPIDEPPSKPTPTENAVLDAAIWPDILQALKQKYNTLYGVIRMAEPKFTEEELELHFAFAFHQKRINEPANKKVLSDCIEKITGQHVSIKCFHTKTAKPKPVAAKKNDSADLDAINSVFGGGEILK